MNVGNCDPNFYKYLKYKDKYLKLKGGASNTRRFFLFCRIPESLNKEFISVQYAVQQTLGKDLPQPKEIALLPHITLLSFDYSYNDDNPTVIQLAFENSLKELVQSEFVRDTFQVYFKGVFITPKKEFEFLKTFLTLQYDAVGDSKGNITDFRKAFFEKLHAILLSKLTVPDCKMTSLGTHHGTELCNEIIPLGEKRKANGVIFYNFGCDVNKVLYSVPEYHYNQDSMVYHISLMNYDSIADDFINSIKGQLNGLLVDGGSISLTDINLGESTHITCSLAYFVRQPSEAGSKQRSVDYVSKLK